MAKMGEPTPADWLETRFFMHDQTFNELGTIFEIREITWGNMGAHGRITLFSF